VGAARTVVEGPSDFELEFLDFSPSAETGEQALPDIEEGADFLDAYSQAVTNVVAKVGPAVVNIRVKRKASSRRGTAPYDVEGSASGVIITPDGYIVNNRIAYRMGNRDPYMAPHSVYRCRGDDCWVAIAISSEDEWENLCCVMDHPEWAEDPKFATMLGRKDNEEELDRLIGEWTKDYPAEQIMAMMQDAGVPCGVVQNAEDLFNDPQLKHREHFRFLEHKVIGAHAYHAPAYRLSKTPNYIWKAGPCLGEDNEYVYKEVLGYTDDEIADLLIEGVITTEADLPGVSTF
jgi:hypothetical protein